VPDLPFTHLGYPGALTAGVGMGTMVEAITDEEFIGYLAAMMRNDPWGEPVTSLAEMLAPSPR